MVCLEQIIPSTTSSKAQQLTGEALEHTLEHCLHSLLSLCHWSNILSPSNLVLLRRIAFTVLKDRAIPRQDMRQLRQQLEQTLVATQQPTNNNNNDEEPAHKKPRSNEIQTMERMVKPKPNAESGEGWTVLEFFSGMGGMRLGLPTLIDNIGIAKIVAFDCSHVPNQVIIPFCLY